MSTYSNGPAERKCKLTKNNDIRDKAARFIQKMFRSYLIRKKNLWNSIKFREKWEKDDLKHVFKQKICKEAHEKLEKLLPKNSIAVRDLKKKKEEIDNKILANTMFFQDKNKRDR